MSGPITPTAPPRRPRRAGAKVAALLLLLVGVGLLAFSYLTWYGPNSAPASGPIPTTTPSPLAQTQTLPAPSPSAGGSVEPPRVVVVTTYIAVPRFIDPPASTEQSNMLALITSISGLLASLAGIVSAIVSIRGPRPR